MQPIQVLLPGSKGAMTMEFWTYGGLKNYCHIALKTLYFKYNIEWNTTPAALKPKWLSNIGCATYSTAVNSCFAQMSIEKSMLLLSQWEAQKY